MQLHRHGARSAHHPPPSARSMVKPVLAGRGRTHEAVLLGEPGQGCHGKIDDELRFFLFEPVVVVACRVRGVGRFLVLHRKGRPPPFSFHSPASAWNLLSRAPISGAAFYMLLVLKKGVALGLILSVD